MSISNLAPWLEGLLIVGLCVAFALAGMGAARTRVTPVMMEPLREVAGFFLSLIGTLYAVILAFAVLIVWQQYNSAQAAVNSEANSLADLARLARELPPEVGRRLQTDLEAYARSIVDREWSAMTAGAAAPETDAALDALWRTSLREIKGRTPAEEAIRQLAISQLGNLSDGRQARLEVTLSGVPVVVWILLWGGGAITVAFTFHFVLSDVRWQAGMTAALAAQIGFILFLIGTLDNPFRGTARISDQPIRQALSAIQTK
jgi:hypothetical protein